MNTSKADGAPLSGIASAPFGIRPASADAPVWS
jgi:hypothetical protein